MYKYYSTQRPIEPGSFPNRPDNRVKDIVNYDERVPVEAGAFLAWGELTYEAPLTHEELRAYELRAAAGQELEAESMKATVADNKSRFITLETCGIQCLEMTEQELENINDAIRSEIALGYPQRNKYAYNCILDEKGLLPMTCDIVAGMMVAKPSLPTLLYMRKYPNFSELLSNPKTFGNVLVIVHRPQSEAISKILDALPKEPTEGTKYWTNGDVILCKTDDAANTIADFLESLGLDPTTGYYDPVEDAESGEADALTGYYYVDC